jgi:hypothetical protein
VAGGVFNNIQPTDDFSTEPDIEQLANNFTKTKKSKIINDKSIPIQIYLLISQNQKIFENVINDKTTYTTDKEDSTEH